MQLDVLWQFMQVDMEADRFEEKMRTSEIRQKLIKQRNLLKELQGNMTKLENDVAIMQDRLDAVRDEAERLDRSLSAMRAEIETNPPQTIDEAQKKLEAMKKLVETLERYEQELQKLSKDSDVKDRQQKEIRVRAAKSKAEYDSLKAVYDGEYKRDSQKLQSLRGAAEKEATKVDSDLLSSYKRIKQHCTPPMAKVLNDQCSGCFMSLPSATILAIKNSGSIVECDNCGRILFQPE